MSVRFDERGPIHLGAARRSELAAGAVALVGVGYDGTASFRPGARFGPRGIRQASYGLESYSPALQADLDDFTLVDMGDVEIPFGAPGPVVELARQAAEVVLEADARPLFVGGEHSVTSGPLSAVAARHPDLLVVQLDAHADLRDDYLGEPHNHACAMRRAIDILGEPRLVQVGIRSGTREEWHEMRAAGRVIPGHAAALAQQLDRWGPRPIYLTIDLDVFDPACLPGTGTPEPGGIDWHGFELLSKVLHGRRVVAADVMELAPDLDPTGCSAVLAAKVVREVALMLCAG